MQKGLIAKVTCNPQISTGHFIATLKNKDLISIIPLLKAIPTDSHEEFNKNVLSIMIEKGVRNGNFSAIKKLVIHFLILE